MVIPTFWPDACLSTPQPFSRRHAGLLLALAAVLLQAPLWLNPGYFSHDELQWAARAMGPSVAELPFVSLLAIDSFQYRPLTFNLWLLLSHALFETPRLFHVVFVLVGTLNALLLANVLRRAGVGMTTACGAALVFSLSPFAVWVHGWVGCLADLIWVCAGLALVRVLQGLGPARGAVVIATLCALLATALALLAKEAALSIPALLALATMGLRFPRHWVAATLASAVIAMLYLVLRLDVLLQPAMGSSYTVQAWTIPQRWLEYQVFPWALGASEIHVLALGSRPRWLALVLLLVALLLTLWRASPRLTVAWVAGGVLALAPVLVLPISSNQYGYGFIALSCGLVALAVPQMRRNGRILVGVLALLTVVHGFQVQAELWRVGRVQAVFSPSLAAEAKAQPVGEIRLWPDSAKRAYVFRRLSNDIPSYAGVALGQRVGMAETADQATHGVSADGTVRPRLGLSP